MSRSSVTGPDAFTGTTPDTALRTADAEQKGAMLAADGTPLKRSLNRALRAQKLRALALIAPLLLFVVITFIAPIADMLFRSVENQIVVETLPRTVATLDEWDGDGLPDDATFQALSVDLSVAAELKTHTRLGSRLNYENTGLSSLFRKSGRGVDEIGEGYLDQFVAVNPAWEDPLVWAELMGDPAWLAQAREADGAGPRFELAAGIDEILPRTADAYTAFADIVQTVDNDNPADEEPWAIVYQMLYLDLMDAPQIDGPPLLAEAAAAVPGFATFPAREGFAEIDDGWTDPATWRTIKTFSGPYTSGYFLTAADLRLTPDGIQREPEETRIYATLFGRTMFMSLTIMGCCILLGYPIAFLLSNLPMRTSNILLILVLLPFWTSLLVRTSAWKVLLQEQGVINDILVWIGLVSDGNRLALINNQAGTIIAMTHILLPFMILPLYSVMKTIPPSYMRAAKSLGATDWTAFWRVYFPQSVPGIGAGCILVFILSIGYYITPELVGGTTGTFISNRIAYHISQSLNWGLAAALGTILLAFVLALYWIYDRIVGIDNVSLG
ncbi:ABC polyamine/opine transporter, inner membrane subunit [Oceaniovalibus guishaninsula JLT2003]|uniref:ABC polyamine/opine transporter, inner membrane subunit n=1 Tax=Oceaniovalibus guishaninsula JLT2003 TaxID=1231392 RepID=K2GRX7_9RHOB|nr:ABC transporter permease [Oceaniovalibus guishaninsula]EKE45401.1 ABC polyamine/opine transporter, inner membrane subunit [Oceaniovalibus guishaninsula JLT2003]